MAGPGIDICARYVADPKVQEWIDNAPDPFYGSYRKWIGLQRPDDVGDMLQIFGGWTEAKEKLAAGDPDNGGKGGGVLAVDCQKFKRLADLGADFKYSADEIAELRLRNTLLGIDDEIGITFEAALKKYFAVPPVALSPLESLVLNGALFVQVNIGVAKISTAQPDRKLFAVPGYLVHRFYERSLSAPSWSDVDKILTDAVEKTGSHLINVSTAVQLRLGSDHALYGRPVEVAPGFTIKGRV